MFSEQYTALRRSCVAVLLCAVVGSACRRGSPTREQQTREHSRCSSAAASVAGGADSFDTFVTLAWCDQSGPAAIAARWGVALPRDTLALRAFLFASGNLRDGRLFGAALRAAADSARPEPERGAALLVLAAQFDSSTAIMVTDVPRWRAILGHSAHPSRVIGSVPLPPDARERVEAVVASVLDGKPGGLRRSVEPLYGAALDARYVLQHLLR